MNLETVTQIDALRRDGAGQDTTKTRDYLLTLTSKIKPDNANSLMKFNSRMLIHFRRPAKQSHPQAGAGQVSDLRKT